MKLGLATSPLCEHITVPFHSFLYETERHKRLKLCFTTEPQAKPHWREAIQVWQVLVEIHSENAFEPSYQECAREGAKRAPFWSQQTCVLWSVQ